MVKREEKKKKELNLFWMCIAIVAIVAVVGIVSLINSSPKEGVITGQAVCTPSTKYTCSGSTQVLTETSSKCVKKTTNTPCPAGCNWLTGKCKPVTTIRTTARSTTRPTTATSTTRPTTTSVCPTTTTWKCSGTYEVMTKTENCQTQTYLPGNYCPTPGCNPNTGRCYVVSTTTSRRTTIRSTTTIPPPPPTTPPSTIYTPIATCAESDGGLDTTTYGNCVQSNGQSFDDHCHGNMLTEYSCEDWAGGKICKEYSGIYCSATCFAGACM